MADRRTPNRLTPTINRQMAQVQVRALRKPVDRRGLAISVFAFFATLFTLGGFALSNWQGSDNPAPVAPPPAATSPEPVSDQAGNAATGTGDEIVYDPPNGSAEERVAAASDDEGFVFGEPMSNWFSDDEGGWGVPQ